VTLPTILLIGSAGQLGSELARALPAHGNLIALDRAALDLCDADAIVAAVRDARPQMIINAAAYTAVDRAESEPDRAAAINARAPAILADEAQRGGAVLDRLCFRRRVRRSLRRGFAAESDQRLRTKQARGRARDRRGRRRRAGSADELGVRVARPELPHHHVEARRGA
jgi:hypothetical protein